MTNVIFLRDPLVFTAFHEAGHTVMAHLCGQIVTTSLEPEFASPGHRVTKTLRAS